MFLLCKRLSIFVMSSEAGSVLALLVIFPYRTLHTRISFCKQKYYFEQSKFYKILLYPYKEYLSLYLHTHITLAAYITPNTHKSINTRSIPTSTKKQSRSKIYTEICFCHCVVYKVKIGQSFNFVVPFLLLHLFSITKNV